MYFCNLFEETGVKTFKRFAKAGTLPFINDRADRLTEGYVAKVNNELRVVESEEKNLFLRGLSGSDSEEFLPKLKTNLTYADIKDSQENPMIITLAKTIKFYQGVKTYIKYINISSNCVLVMLVFGACDVTFDDGTEITFQRCNNSVLDGKRKYEYTGETLRELSHLEDSECGYVLSNDVVNAVIVNKHNESCSSYRTVKDHVEIFDSKFVSAARKAYSEAQRLKEEERARKVELNRIANEKAKIKMQQKHKEEIEKKEKGSTTKKQTMSVGGSDFLRSVFEA